MTMQRALFSDRSHRDGVANPSVGRAPINDVSESFLYRICPLISKHTLLGNRQSSPSVLAKVLISGENVGTDRVLFNDNWLSVWFNSPCPVTGHSLGKDEYLRKAVFNSALSSLCSLKSFPSRKPTISHRRTTPQYLDVDSAAKSQALGRRVIETPITSINFSSLKLLKLYNPATYVKLDYIFSIFILQDRGRLGIILSKWFNNLSLYKQYMSNERWLVPHMGTGPLAF